MRAQKIYENIDFERGRNPKVVMGLGHITWDNLQAGDIIQATTLVGIAGSGDIVFSANWDRLSKGQYVLITHIKRHPDGKALSIDGEKSMDLESFKKGHYNEEVYFWATIRRLKTRFRIIQRHEMNEFASFERGRDPKKALDIGRDKWIKSLSWPLFIQRDLDQILSDERTEVIRYKDQVILLYPEKDFGNLGIHNPWKSEQIWHAGSPIINPMDTSSFAHTRAGSKEKALKNAKGQIRYQLQKIEESIEFERGKDPKEVMGIGNKDEQWRKKVDRMISPKGFTETIINVGPESHLHDIAQWEGKTPAGKVTVILSRNLDPTYAENPYMSTVYIGRTDDINNISAEISEDDMGISKYWDNAINGKPLHESIEFERGQDPKTSMGLGESINILSKRAWAIIKKTDWSETGIQSPEKADFYNWMDEFKAYADVTTILENDPMDIKIAFEDHWEEIHEDFDY